MATVHQIQKEDGKRSVALYHFITKLNLVEQIELEFIDYLVRQLNSTGKLLAGRITIDKYISRRTNSVHRIIRIRPYYTYIHPLYDFMAE